MRGRILSIGLVVVILLILCAFQSGIAKTSILTIANSGAGIFHNKPDYDSGWTPIEAGDDKIFQHDLGGDTDNFIVDLEFKDTVYGLGINQYGYGGSEFIQFGPPGGRIYQGAYWFGLTEKIIRVRRLSYTNVNEVRLRIWIVPAPAFDSGWMVVKADGGLKLIEHNLMGNPEDYIVDMQFMDTDQFGLGIHQFRYGMNYTFMGSFDLFPESTGALWSNLGSETIWVARGKDDEVVDKLRVRIWDNADPDYSGWLNLKQGETKTITHNLTWDPDNYVVDFQFYDSKYAGMGINQQYYGGNEFTTSDGLTLEAMGASWSNLTSNRISIQRRSDDASAPEGRIRIWVLDNDIQHIYMPVLPNSY